MDKIELQPYDVYAYIGKLTLKIEFLERQLALLQQQIVQSQQAQANGKEPDELPEVAIKVKA